LPYIYRQGSLGSRNTNVTGREKAERKFSGRAKAFRRNAQSVEKSGNLPIIKAAPVTISDKDQISPESLGAIQRATVRGRTPLEADGEQRAKSEIACDQALFMQYDAVESLKPQPEGVCFCGLGRRLSR